MKRYNSLFQIELKEELSKILNSPSIIFKINKRKVESTQFINSLSASLIFNYEKKFVIENLNKTKASLLEKLLKINPTINFLKKGKKVILN